MKTLFVRISACIALVLTVSSSFPVFAADGWEANLTVTVQRADLKLSFGQKTDATDAGDGLYDVPPMPGGDVSAFFVHTDGNLWRDIRALETGKKVWALRIASPLQGETVQLTWKPETLPADAVAVLIDEGAGKRVDMKVLTRYAYVNAGQRDLKIEIKR